MDEKKPEGFEAQDDSTFASRMQGVAREAREEKVNAMSKRKKENIALMEDEKDIARVLLNLMDTENFKKYLGYEAQEIGHRLTASFDDPPSGVLPGADFGTKMAFNKGRYYQMEHFRKWRAALINRYLEWTKLEKEEGQ